MARNKDAESTCENWELTKDTLLLEEQEKRKAPKGAVLSLLTSSPQRAVVLLYVLLALGFVLFMALTIMNIRKVSAVWEALDQARLQGEKSHATAWHNLSEVQHALDKQLSGELQAIHSQLLNVSQEVENMQWKMAQCRAECGKELSDRIRVLEGRDALEPALQQLEELKQEQSRTSALLSAVLEEARNLSEILCTRCPAGWQQFAKTCYFFSTDMKPWMEAKASCAELGGQLAIVNTEQENKFVANHIMETRVFWLGLSDMHKEGDWQWLDGRSLSLEFWKSGEPNNVGHQGEDCATVSSSGLWNDATCSSAEAWVCERSC
ncbi:CL17A protein, partial [Anseranas semipalmata]|nr:CL17A protein [Anseranas semipalmata]